MGGHHPTILMFRITHRNRMYRRIPVQLRLSLYIKCDKLNTCVLLALHVMRMSMRCVLCRLTSSCCMALHSCSASNALYCGSRTELGLTTWCIMQWRVICY